jgi:hypothetical protein
MDYELMFLKSLLLSISIETAVLIFMFTVVYRKEKVKLFSIVSAGLVATFATLPYLWFVLTDFIDQRIWYVIIGESFAVIVETFIIAVILKISLSKAFISSFICNLISFSVGLLISYH